MNSKIVLIDGHSILNRAFYGLPDLSLIHIWRWSRMEWISQDLIFLTEITRSRKTEWIC